VVSPLTDCKHFVAGRAQVLVGIVPRVGPVYSQQSAKSVYPLSIANCKENRLVNYNLLHYTIHFTILNYISDFIWLIAFTCIAWKTE